MLSALNQSKGAFSRLTWIDTLDSPSSYHHGGIPLGIPLTAEQHLNHQGKIQSNRVRFCLIFSRAEKKTELTKIDGAVLVWRRLTVLIYTHHTHNCLFCILKRMEQRLTKHPAERQNQWWHTDSARLRLISNQQCREKKNWYDAYIKWKSMLPCTFHLHVRHWNTNAGPSFLLPAPSREFFNNETDTGCSRKDMYQKKKKNQSIDSYGDLKSAVLVWHKSAFDTHPHYTLPFWIHQPRASLPAIHRT